jgi:hypothetical protein
VERSAKSRRVLAYALITVDENESEQALLDVRMAFGDDCGFGQVTGRSPPGLRCCPARAFDSWVVGPVSFVAVRPSWAAGQAYPRCGTGQFLR